jgi:hypothetical protein
MKKCYKNQRNNTSCGVAVIENAAIWANKKLSPKAVKLIAKKLKYKTKIGVQAKDLEKYLNGNTQDCGFITVETIELPSIGELRSVFKKDRAIIFGFDFKYFAHVCLIIKMSKHYITLANLRRGSPTCRMSLKTYRKMLKDSWCIGHVIEKC